MKEYAVVVIDGKQYSVHPRMAQIFEELSQRDDYNHLFELAFEWYKLHVDWKGRKVTRSSMEVG